MSAPSLRKTVAATCRRLPKLHQSPRRIAAGRVSKRKIRYDEVGVGPRGEYRRRVTRYREPTVLAACNYAYESPAIQTIQECRRYRFRFKVNAHHAPKPVRVSCHQSSQLDLHILDLDDRTLISLGLLRNSSHSQQASEEILKRHIM